MRLISIAVPSIRQQMLLVCPRCSVCAPQQEWGVANGVSAKQVWHGTASVATKARKTVNSRSNERQCSTRNAFAIDAAML
jgi:hypothetical protein